MIPCKHRHLIPYLAAILLVLLSFSLISCGAKVASDVGESVSKPENGSINGGSMTTDKIEDVSDSYGRKVIRNASVYAETENYPEAVEKLEASVTEFGGYVKSSYVSGNSLQDNYQSKRTATYTFCIPSERLDDFLDQVDGTLNVTSSQVSEQDITAEYYDLQSRINTLQIEKERITEMLKSADNVSEMLAIEQRLYDVIEEYEAKQTQMNVYNTNIAYSEVNLTLREVQSYTAQANTSFGQKIVSAFRTSWQNFGRGFMNFVVWLVSAIPTILVMVVIVGAIITIVLSSSRHTRKKREANLRAGNPQENQEQTQEKK